MSENSDPFAGVETQIATLPSEGLAFAVMTPTADGIEPDFLSHRGAFAELSRRIAAVNSNAHLLVLPAGWSFRTMDRGQACDFAANMLAFVPDEDLAALGLRRTDPADTIEAPPLRGADGDKDNNEDEQETVGG